MSSPHKRRFIHELEDSIPSCSRVNDNSSEAAKRPRLTLDNRLYFNKILGHPTRFSANALSFDELVEAISPVASIHFNFEVDLSWVISKYPSKCGGSPVSIVVGERDVFDIQRDARNGKFPNVVVGGASLPIPYGSHHTKLSLFESDSGRLHVIISTANLVQGDWENKTQEFFHCSGGFRDGGFTRSSFQDELVFYLNFYAKSKAWSLIEYWRDRVSNADLSAVKANIICSVPGYHSGNDLYRFGHMRLRRLLSDMNLQLTKPVFHAQFSSIGSLGPKPESWLLGQFLQSLNGGKRIEDVRNSVEGYLAGGSLPYAKATASRQPYLVTFMHKWRCERFGRTRAMPHVKTYAAFNDDEVKPVWLVVTSANLSKAAWGELQKNNSQLGIRSYELGVVLTDDVSMEMLPYDVPLVKYTSADQVWVWDNVYKKPDIYGARWP